MPSPLDGIGFLDPFNTRAAPEDPLSYGGRWTTISLNPQRIQMNVNHELLAAVPLSSSPGLALWTPEVFRNAAFSISALVNAQGFMEMRARASSDGETKYYSLRVNAALGSTALWGLSKKVGATGAVLDSATGPALDTFIGTAPYGPDAFGFTLDGDELGGWYYDGHTGAWTQVLAATDTDLERGYFVLAIQGNDSEYIHGLKAGNPFFAPAFDIGFKAAGL